MEAKNIMVEKEQTIVVAVDESEESMYALSWCLTNLVPRNSKSKLILLYVKPPAPVFSFDTSVYVSSRDETASMEKYGSETANLVMKRAEAVYSNFRSDVKMERVVGSGDAKRVICDTVEEIGADTLVMGSHRYGFLQRAFLGSVSDHCVRHVNCPVVIVKQPRSVKTQAERKIDILDMF